MSNNIERLAADVFLIACHAAQKHAQHFFPAGAVDGDILRKTTQIAAVMP